MKIEDLDFYHQTCRQKSDSNASINPQSSADRLILSVTSTCCLTY